MWIPALSAIGAGFAIGLAAIGSGVGQAFRATVVGWWWYTALQGVGLPCLWLTGSGLRCAKALMYGVTRLEWARQYMNLRRMARVPCTRATFTCYVPHWELTNHLLTPLKSYEHPRFFLIRGLSRTIYMVEE